MTTHSLVAARSKLNAHCKFCRSREYFGDVGAGYIANVEITGAGDTVGLFDEFCLCDTDKFVEHSVNADVPSTGLMDQPRDGHEIEIGLDAVGIEGG